MSAMDVTIYHNPRCSKSRQALALLQEKGLEPRVVDVAVRRKAGSLQVERLNERIQRFLVTRPVLALHFRLRVLNEPFAEVQAPQMLDEEVSFHAERIAVRLSRTM